MAKRDSAFAGAAVGFVEARIARMGSAVAHRKADFGHGGVDIPPVRAFTARARAGVERRGADPPLACMSVALVEADFEPWGTETARIRAGVTLG
jgi:hypothetical protein